METVFQSKVDKGTRCLIKSKLILTWSCATIRWKAKFECFYCKTDLCFKIYNLWFAIYIHDYVGIHQICSQLICNVFQVYCIWYCIRIINSLSIKYYCIYYWSCFHILILYIFPKIFNWCHAWHPLILLITDCILVSMFLYYSICNL